jgi:hypothetical protein
MNIYKKYLSERIESKQAGQKIDTKRPVIVVSNDIGDWISVYVKGKSVYQGHDLSWEEMVEILEKAGLLRKNSISSVYDYDMMGSSHFSDKLEDLEL